MSHRPSHREQLERLFDAFFQELESLPDHDILEGESPSSVNARALRRIEQATAEAGRRRLSTAKQEWNKRKLGHPPRAATATATEARAYVAKAARDARNTLAARNLDEMSDEDVLRLYDQIRELEAEDSKRRQ
jgi:hypothetical protein